MAIVIRLNDEQERRILTWSSEITEAEVAAGCEPSGYDLVVSVYMDEPSVRVVNGSRVLDLGMCDFQMGDDPEGMFHG